jgi:hypothetical protein
MSNPTTLDDAPAQGAASTPVSADAALLVKHHEDLSGERRILTIHQDPGMGDEGKHAVFVGLNGVGYQVPRSKPVNVPVELVNNLENARYKQYSRNEKGEVIESEVPRFAMTIMPAPSVGKAAKAAAAGKTTK